MSCARDSALTALGLLLFAAFMPLLFFINNFSPFFSVHLDVARVDGHALLRRTYQLPYNQLCMHERPSLPSYIDFWHLFLRHPFSFLRAYWLGLLGDFFFFFFYRGERTNTITGTNQPVFPLSLLIVVYMGCTMRNVFSPGRAPACCAPLAHSTP